MKKVLTSYIFYIRNYLKDDFLNEKNQNYLRRKDDSSI